MRPDEIRPDTGRTGPVVRTPLDPALIAQAFPPGEQGDYDLEDLQRAAGEAGLVFEALPAEEVQGAYADVPVLSVTAEGFHILPPGEATGPALAGERRFAVRRPPEAPADPDQPALQTPPRFGFGWFVPELLRYKRRLA